MGQMERFEGPFSFDGDGTNGGEAVSPYRVGSMIWTPLHMMAAGNTPYSVMGEGSTNWNGVNAVIIDVEFGADTYCCGFR
jgi:hypothetical protein